MVRKKNNWILYGGIAAVVGSIAAWHFHPPFRRIVCNNSIGVKLPFCKQEPGYVANENDLNPENMRGNITPGLSDEIAQALGKSDPPTVAQMRAYATRRGNRKRFPKLKSSR